MKKAINTRILVSDDDAIGIIVKRGDEALIFTKIGVQNKKIKGLINEDPDIDFRITSIFVNPKHKTLKKNFSEFVKVAKDKVDLSKFTLIRRLGVTNKKYQAN
jgi:hypothetical protein